MIDEIELAKQRVQEARERLEGLEARKFQREELPQRRKLVGKFFKYHNSYGGDRPKWWLYLKVKAIDKDGHLVMNEIQIDCDGRVEIKENQWRPHRPMPDGGYLPATKREWDAAVKEAQDVLKRLS